MSCGVLVVSPASPRSPEGPGGAQIEARAEKQVEKQDGAGGLGHELAELLRSAGHEVVECDAPADLCGARGVVEAAWVVLAGLDLLILVDGAEDGAEDDAEDGAVPTLIGQRARELMTDRGLGGSLVHVPPDVPVTQAAACLLELLDPDPPVSRGAEPARSPCAASSPLRVEQVPSRGGDAGTGDREAGRSAATGAKPSLVRGPLAGGPRGTS